MIWTAWQPTELCWERLKMTDSQNHATWKWRTTWVPAGFFPGVGNEGVWRTEVPQQGLWAAPRWVWRHFPKMMHKYCIYWGFRQHLQQKTLFNISMGASAPLPMPAGAHGGPSKKPWRKKFIFVCWYTASECSGQVRIYEGHWVKVGHRSKKVL